DALGPISPRARRVAQELGVDARALTGSGPGGRIVERDVRAAGQGAPATPAVPERVLASPLARKLATEYRVDLGTLRGSGPGGRIVEKDVLAAVGRRPAAGVEPSAPVQPVQPAAEPAPAAAAASRPPAAGGQPAPLGRLRRITA